MKRTRQRNSGSAGWLRRSIVLGILAAAGSGTGCESSPAATAAEPREEMRDRGRGRARADGGRYRRPAALVGNRIQARLEAIAVMATLRHWHQEVRDEALTYELDPYDQRISPRLRQRTQSLFPPVDSPVVESHRIFSFHNVLIPEKGWMVAIYRESNLYWAAKHATVFEVMDGRLEVRDHLLVAEGLLESVLMGFSWEKYRQSQRREAALANAGREASHAADATEAARNEPDITP